MKHVTEQELAEAKEKYLGNTVYSYRVQNYKIILQKKEITGIQIKADIDDNGKQGNEYIQAIVGNYYYLPLSNIGNIYSFTQEWLSFDQNDKQARQILYGYHSASMNRTMTRLIEDMARYKKDYDAILKTVSSGEIIKEDILLR